MIRLSRHVKEQVRRRFENRLDITPEWVRNTVNDTIHPNQLEQGSETWVRVAVLDKEIIFEADTADGAINGDELIAVIKWNEQYQHYKIVTLELRRSGQSQKCDNFWDADDLTYIRI